jgi:hypothetical protein
MGGGQRTTQLTHQPLFCWILCACAHVVLVVLTSRPGHASDVLLQWTVPPERNVAGYRVYAGNAPRTYDTSRDVGLLSNATVAGVVHNLYSGVQPGVSYYLAVTAYNTGRVESAYSNEKVLTLSTATPPRADAGPDQVGEVDELLPLGAAADPGVNYLWIQTTGPPATLSSQTSSQPDVRGDTAGTYTFTLIAYDAQGLAAQDTVTVVLTGFGPTPTPTAAAGPSATNTPGASMPSPSPTPSATPQRSGVRLYLTALPPSYHPMQPQGQWEIAPGTQVLWSPSPGGVFGNALRQEAASTPVDIGLLWAISEPLADVQFTSASTLSWGIETAAQQDDAELYWHVHLGVLAGASDSVRCTLLDNYREAPGRGTPWPISPQGLGPAQPVPLNDCGGTPPQPGDRLAIELGYVAHNLLTAPLYGFLDYGTTDSDVVPGQPGGAPWVDFLDATLRFVGQPTDTAVPPRLLVGRPAAILETRSQRCRPALGGETASADGSCTASRGDPLR